MISNLSRHWFGVFLLWRGIRHIEAGVEVVAPKSALFFGRSQYPLSQTRMIPTLHFEIEKLQ